MKVDEIITLVDTIKPNKVSEDLKLKVLDDIECRILCDIFGKDAGEHKALTSMDDELSVGSPHSQMYIFSLLSLVALVGKEYEYSSALASKYEQAFLNYAKYCLRNRQNTLKIHK